MVTNTLWCFSPHSALPPNSPSSSSSPFSWKKMSFFFKPSMSISCCTKDQVDIRSSIEQVEIARQWVEASSPLPSISQERFTVASYNILAVRNASKHRDLYSLVPSEYIKWDRRKRILCEELIKLDSDIVCLQEVDRYHELGRTMEKKGYVGSYKRRTGDTVDGCAIFWKADKFRLLEEESIEFKKFGLRDNVAQIFVFEMLKANLRRVLVGNIHVLFSQSRGDIKLGQTRLFLSRAYALQEKWGYVPVVLAGDFNSTPQSAVYQFLASSELDVTLYNKGYLSGQQGRQPSQSDGFQGHMSRTTILMERFLKTNWTEEEVKTATGSTSATTAEHQLNLASSYASVKGTEESIRTRDSYGEPLATSFHSKFLGTVDYLWYSDGLVPTRVLDIPPIDLLKKTHGLPHKNLGSDHLSLVSEFAFTQ